ncbi:MAG: ATP-binding protein [Candidatus Competibacteraceae bacterium]
MSKRPLLRLVPLCDPDDFQAALYDDESLTLAELLQRAPALSTEPIAETLLQRPLSQLIITPVEAGPECGLYRPPGLRVGRQPESVVTVSPEPAAPEVSEPAATIPAMMPYVHPQTLSEGEAVRLAYAQEIDRVASFLRSHLSVLVVCDKLVVEHLWRDMARRAGLREIVLAAAEEEGGELMPRSLRQRQMALLKELTQSLKRGDVLVIPHLDLLAGGADTNLSNETREFIELVYSTSDRLMLAFADRSLVIPEVLAARFAVRVLISGVPRTVSYPDGSERLLGEALITAAEAGCFNQFNPEGLYKNVAGMNPIQIRHAIVYAVKEHTGAGPVPVERLYQAIRAFKVQTSANFEVPDVGFEDIGGYDEVKTELNRALELMAGSYRLPDERLRRELIPRGFIFHGPPGTGKTLFAKAIANKLNATVQVVSGPEIMDMYVGESERKIRELFAEARRNAPAVLVFDEFDAIAARRSGREDGGSRAGNAVVAQILTEMDGFRADVPLLVIGTTNRLDIIDAALLRPSRFQAITIGLPDTAARRAIAAVHARRFQVEVAPELVDLVAEITAGCNGDEIRSLFRDACVGLYCENPPLPADARRFEELVARLRRAAEQRLQGTGLL